MNNRIKLFLLLLFLSIEVNIIVLESRLLFFTKYNTISSVHASSVPISRVPNAGLTARLELADSLIAVTFWCHIPHRIMGRTTYTVRFYGCCSRQSTLAKYDEARCLYSLIMVLFAMHAPGVLYVGIYTSYINRKYINMFGQ